jgi:hypothetical protein
VLTWSVFRRRVPPATAVGIVAVILVGAAGIYLYVPPRVAPPSPPAVAAGRAVLPPGSYPSEPLEAGTPVPELTAVGWLNGSPPEPDEPAPQLILLDIWSGW